MRRLSPRFVAKAVVPLEDRRRILGAATSRKAVAELLRCSQETAAQIVSPLGSCTPETLARVQARLAELGL